MLGKIRKTIRKYEMLNPGDHVVAAVSGGPDSVALLQVLIRLAPEYDLTLTAAHLNHGLRGSESDAEEQLVRRLSEEKGIPCAVKRVDLSAIRKGERRKRSLEDIGREERYQFFTELAAEAGATRIALGHHRGDQAETVLMNLIRGSGLEGLKGILPVRDGCIIRPLIEVGREEILDFLRTERLPFLEDSSNSQDLFLRNRIRHELIPMLQDRYNPQIIHSLNRLAGIARREDDCLQSAVSRILEKRRIASSAEGEKMEIDISEIQDLHEALQYRLIKVLLESRISPHFRISFKHIQSVMDLCREGKTDGLLILPGNVVVRREYGKLTFSSSDSSITHTRSSSEEEKRGKGFFYPVQVPGIVRIAELGRVIKTEFVEKREDLFSGESKNSACFDFDKVEGPLVIRNRREGDRFQPLGMAGTKKLKAYFIDEKIPRRQRDHIPLVADRHSVIWIAGLRLSERVRIEEKTRHIVKIEMI